jgi:glutaredoxin-related protein
MSAVTLFTIPNCGECQAVKEFLQQQGVAWVEVDVAGSLANLRRLRRLSDARRVPVAAWQGEVVVGFDPGALTALAKKVEAYQDDQRN